MLKRIRSEACERSGNQRLLHAGKQAIEAVRHLEEKLPRMFKGVVPSRLHLQFVSAAEFNQQEAASRVKRGAYDIAYDPAGNAAYVNEENTLFLIRPDHDASRFRDLLTDGLLDAIARSLQPNASLTEFLNKKRELLEQMTDVKKGVPLSHFTEKSRLEVLEGGKLNPLRVYEAAEVARLSRQPLGFIRYLVDTGAITGTYDRIQGSNALAALNKLDGYTSLYEIMHNAEEQRGQLNYVHAKHAHATYQLAQITRGISFIRDIGLRHPCYVVHKIFVPEVERLLNQGLSTRAICRVKAPNPLLAIENRFASLSEAAADFHADVKDLKKVVAYAARERLPLEERKFGATMQYRFTHLVHAYDALRKEKS